MDHETALRETAARFPERPGCYLFKDGAGEILYVGKALSLKARIASYFAQGRGEKETRLAAAARALEFVITPSEREALILENQLVKRHQPPFNVMLRDDKTFPYLKLKVKQPIPQLEFTRKLKKDGALYYGPFLPASGARRVLELARRVTGVATCHEALDGNRGRPCLYYQIHQCLGPCVSTLVTPERYAEAVEQTRLLLEGKNRELTAAIATRMRAAAGELKFEEAAMLRDALRGLESLSGRSAVDWASARDADAVGWARLHRRAAVVVLAVRGGRVSDKAEYFITEPERDDGETLALALTRYYGGRTMPPALYLPFENPKVAAALAALAGASGSRVPEVKAEARGSSRRLLAMAAENAAAVLNHRLHAAERWQQIAGALQRALELSAPPRRIACFDISNLGRTEIVASMVVQMDGRERKSEYKRFKIRHQERQNDFAALQEATLRHFTRCREEGKPLPDLLLIDGGFGQLGAVGEVLSDAGFESQPMASLAKREERVCLPGRAEPVRFDRHDPALHALQRVRDEAHRFAITYHRTRRSMTMTRSFLDDVPGIGPGKKRKLLRHFITMDALKQAPLDKLRHLLGKRTGAALHGVLEQMNIGRGGAEAPRED